MAATYPHPLNNAIIKTLEETPMNVAQLADHLNRNIDTIRQIMNLMRKHGHEFPNLKPMPHPTRGVIHRKPRKPIDKSVRRVCEICKLPGQLLMVTSRICQVCYLADKVNIIPCKDDPRWHNLIAKVHPEGHCVVCGSSNARHRDGRFCHWTHDPTMLNTQELNEMLDKYNPPARDIWGRLLPVGEQYATR